MGRRAVPHGGGEGCRARFGVTLDESSDFGVVAGNLQRRTPVPVQGVGVRTVFEQPLDEERILFSRSPVQRRIARLILLVGIGSTLQEQGANFDLRFHDGAVEGRRMACVSGLVDVGPMIQKKPHHLDMPALGSQVQGGLALPATNADTGPALKQHGCRFGAAAECRLGEGGHAAAALTSLDVRLMVEKQRRDVRIIPHRSIVQ